MMSRISFTYLIVLLVVAGCGTTQQPEKSSQSSSSSNTQSAPVHVKFETSKGDFVVEVHEPWSPAGAKRFLELVKSGFFDDCRFFRVVDGFMAQVGINGNPEVQKQWRERNIVDDPVVESNRRGYVTFAKSGLPNSRSTQIFINYGNNARLDPDGFSPFGKVTEGMEVVDKLYSGYGDGPPYGGGPNQGRIQEEGNAYLQRSYPKLDYIKKTTVIGEEPANGETPSAAEKNEN